MEQNDVIASNPERAEKMKAMLTAWLKESGARMPVPDPEYSPQARQQFLEIQRKKISEEQNRKRERRLEPDWEPDKTWWGSQQVED